MKLQAISILITLLIVTAFPGTGFSNDPAEDTPWPIGFNAGEMNISRTLMNSYGDLNGDWTFSTFHAGIDIDATTGYLDCDEVRCVDDGYATLVESIEIPGSDGEFEYLVIICDELGGTVQNGWSYGHLDQPPFSQYDPVADSAFVGTMTTHINTPHVHFMWTDWDENEWSYCNPLKYLSPSPIFEENYQWTFNPDNNNPSFNHFFLEDTSYSAWENLTVVETQNLMLDPASLSGNVDFFFGVSLRGDGMPFGQGDGRDDLTSQKIKYDVVRELATCTEILDTRHVFDFDCVLNASPGFDSRAQMLYFRHSMEALFGHEALAYCLTNCNSSDEWDGINNIIENKCWNTDCFEIDPTSSTANPVLARYPDGAYHLDVLCYSFDEDYTFSETVEGVELHNFYPALKEVLVIDAFTDGAYYRAVWEPDASGLLAELNVTSDQPIPAGTELEVVLIFTEEMNTGTGSVSASLGTSSISNGNWTSSVVSNDTWTGEVTMPSGSMDETYVLSVSASDTDNNDLMDPEGAGTVPGPSYDTHHTVTIGSPAFAHQWTTTINAPMLSSPKLADIDGDGILDVVIQSSDGYVDVLDGSGTSLSGWPASGGWSSLDPNVKASPAVVNLNGLPSSSPEILAVHPSGCNGFTSSGTPISGWAGIYGSEYEWHVMSSPVAGDFSNDGDFEYVLGRQHGSSSSNGSVLYGQENNGVSIWSKEWGIDESLSSTPSLCDVDNDGDLEVLAITDYLTISPVDDFGTLYCLDAATGVCEWSYYPFGTFIWGAVVTGNLDSDPQMEVIACGTAGSPVTMVLDGISGNPQYAKSIGNVFAGASIGDVDGDGNPDVVVSSNSSGGTLHCWDGASGYDLPGFPISLGTFTKTGISLGDIDGDGYNEMVIAGMDGVLHAINHDGTEVGGFPVTVSSTALSGQPALGDIDNDGRLEIVFGEEDNSVLHCYEMGENSAYTSLPWPQFQHDAMNTGCYTDPPPAPPTNLQESSSILGDKILVDLTWQ
ncbi:MAG: FG-GAP-like repeat-containing protein, partial [Candidatus Fermentibacteria bacterium]|nr:FG-GAP-like repeat-containing protein [Candidatus Fermentibacteria bacterium]